MFSFEVSSPEQTRELGFALGKLLQVGDYLILTGDLGAGKTTFTQGLGAGLGVEGRVSSPTFIISRLHRGTVREGGVQGPDLLHVDAYRITDQDDLETLDLDTLLTSAVVVVEWGKDKAEAVSAQRLEITLTAESFDPQDVGTDLEGLDSGCRRIEFSGLGQRWADLETSLRTQLSKQLESVGKTHLEEIN